MNKIIKLTSKLEQVPNIEGNLSDYAVQMQITIQKYMATYPAIPEEYWTNVVVSYIQDKFN